MNLRNRDRLTTAYDVMPWLVALAAVVTFAVPMARDALGSEPRTGAKELGPLPAVVATGPVVVATDPYKPGESLPSGYTEVSDKVVQFVQTVPAGRAARVAIIGDSLTVGASTGLEKLLSDVNLTIDAKVGRSMPEGPKAAAATGAAKADIVVVALGTNDSCEVPECKRRINAIVAAVNPNAPLIWMMPAEFRPNMENVRTAIGDVIGKRPRSIVLDWQPYQHDHPEIVISDRIHLTSAGYRLRAEVTANQVHALLGR